MQSMQGSINNISMNWSGIKKYEVDTSL